MCSDVEVGGEQSMMLWTLLFPILRAQATDASSI